MECALTVDSQRLSTELTAVPREYDGIPIVTRVRTAGTPLKVHPDRAASAAVLCFSPFIAGTFSMENGCSPQLGSAIQRWFAPSVVQVGNIDLAPSGRSDGQAILRVADDGATTTGDGSAAASPNTVTCQVVREGSGWIATATHLAVSSNAWLLADDSESRLEQLLPSIGIAILFADDLYASTVVIDGVSRGDDPETWDRLRDLLGAVGLSLQEDG